MGVLWKTGRMGGGRGRLRRSTSGHTPVQHTAPQPHTHVVDHRLSRMQARLVCWLQALNPKLVAHSDELDQDPSTGHPGSATAGQRHCSHRFCYVQRTHVEFGRVRRWTLVAAGLQRMVEGHCTGAGAAEAVAAVLPASFEGA